MIPTSWFIIESVDGGYITESDFGDVDPVAWTDDPDLAMPFKTKRAAEKCVIEYCARNGVILRHRIVKHEF